MSEHPALPVRANRGHGGDRRSSPLVRQAFRHCERLTKGHYENFPIGWFLPRRERPHLYALYAFARTADDFSDEAAFAGHRLEHLDLWAERLAEAARGRPDPAEPVFVALSETIRRRSLPPEFLSDLLFAFRQDTVKKRYRTYEELEEYCRFSANPVGRLVLTLFGYREERLLELSDKICTGIQLVNHWQDIGVDLAKDRIYLPEEDQRRFGVSEDSLRAERIDENFKALMRFEIDRTRGLLSDGRPLLRALRRRLRWQVGLMWAGPLAILERIERNGYDVFRRRPSLSTRDKIMLLWGRRK